MHVKGVLNIALAPELFKVGVVEVVEIRSYVENIQYRPASLTIGTDPFIRRRVDVGSIATLQQS